MRTIHAEEILCYNIIECNNKEKYTPFPYLRSDKGDKKFFSISPYHGRSYMIKQREDNRYVISKGNGLSYTQYQFLNTKEFNDNSWGLLLIKDALRDFNLGMEIHELGIKTNIMECVIELNKEIILSYNQKTLKPILLQYNVESPFRICDALFMTKEEIKQETSKWEKMNYDGYDKKHLIAADVLIKALKTLHSKDIIYNAFHIQNITWALELLDFEISLSAKHPYSEEDNSNHYIELKSREIIQVYEIINTIAWILQENIEYNQIDNLFLKYGFDLNEYRANEI